MLYHLHDIQRKFLNPLSLWAQASSELFSSPYSPLSYTPFARRMAAGYDLLHRLGKQYEKPAFDLPATMIDGTEVAVVEERTHSKPFCHLLHFKRQLPTSLTAHAADPNNQRTIGVLTKVGASSRMSIWMLLDEVSPSPSVTVKSNTMRRLSD